jgi:branched-chain amino acid transport system permease protein
VEDVQRLNIFGWHIDLTPFRILGIEIWQEVPFLIRPIQFTMFVVSMVLLFALQYLVSRTKIGKAMRVVAYNQNIAKLLGINVSLIFALTFFLAGALAGAAGVLQGIAFVFDPFMGEQVALVGLTVIVLGGLGKIDAAVVGAFLVANMQIAVIATGYSWLEEAIVFFALFLSLLVRPQGLLGDPIQDRA